MVFANLACNDDPIVMQFGKHYFPVLRQPSYEFHEKNIMFFKS